jgi:protein TonB
MSNYSFISKKKDRPLLLALCLLFSVLLHLLVIFVLPTENLRAKNLSPKTEKPILVRLVDKPESTRNREYEVDQRPTLPAEKPKLETTRLAEKSQRVEKQQAPKGLDERDQSLRQATPQSSLPTPARKQAPSQPSPPATVKPEPKLPLEKNGQLQQTPAVAQPQTPAEQLPAVYPSVQQLTQLTPSTQNRSINAGRAEREKSKQRDDVDEGDTVWLNLERGLLISFFRRFRNQIEGVWNYPAEAAQQGIEGILLVKITVNRNGELLDVELLNSSSSDILDFEAIQAIYRAAPFGPLPKQYPHPELKINAHFRYQITGRYIYGRP